MIASETICATRESDAALTPHPQESLGLRAGSPLDETDFAVLRRRMLLEGCKWDPQVGDQGTLASFPLRLTPRAWTRLAALAETLAAETLRAEEEILARPELMTKLGLPRRLTRWLRCGPELSPTAARVMRFDFHPTRTGWKISEVNSDVPGGFTEASYFTSLVAEHCPDARPAGSPVHLWADSIARAAGPAGRVGLLTAPGFMEDHQVVAYLAKHLDRLGCQTHLATPSQLEWRGGAAHLRTSHGSRKLDTVVRFYQSEWMPHLPRHCDWARLIRGGRTPVANPATAVISESKRFPLLWNDLRAPMTTWRALLPESRDPRDAPWQRDDRWILKSALSNTGDDVHLREWMNARTWNRMRWDVWCRPSQWIAQRRFESASVETPLGPMHACIGVYTINGQAAGAYGRMARRPLIDYQAIDVAVLIEEDASEPNGEHRDERKDF